jgi:uncharacterized flavoprotein (TIGR03862 family)
MREALEYPRTLTTGDHMPDTQTPAIAVIGAGPAGLMAAERLATAGARVTVFDRMPSPGRKFLMAGRGGLNLTHSEPFEMFVTRYNSGQSHVSDAVKACPPEAVVAWANGLGQETFVGSSGRVFPKAMKASPLLRAWLARLTGLGVMLRLNTRWTGWSDEGTLRFEAARGEAQPDETFDATVLALGGASWPRLGSDGAWRETLASAGVEVAPLQPSNAGFVIDWSPHVRAKYLGEPLKRISLTHGNARARGEAVITARGLEGGAVYALGAAVRDALAAGPAFIHVDLRADLGVAELAIRLQAPRGKDSLANFIRKRAGITAAAIAVLREAHGANLPASSMELAAAIKAVPLTVTRLGGLDRAISTAGGVTWDAIDAQYMLRAKPGVFVAGEMIDWDAPTGGYLMQATFATACAAADGALRYVRRDASNDA